MRGTFQMLTGGEALPRLAATAALPADGRTHAGTGGEARRPFRLKTLTASTAAVADVAYMRGPIFCERAEEPEASLSGTSLWLCAVVNLLTGEVTLGTTPDATMPETSEFYRRPLYRLERTSEETPWHVALDARQGLLDVPAYTGY